VAQPGTRSGLPAEEEREVIDALALEGIVSRSAVASVVDAADAAASAYVTAREAEVLRLVAAGLTNVQIAVQLCLSPHTVKRHLANVCTRASLSGRAHAAAFAQRQGLA
jgi:DNA-binding CsgD family transcriptional regulator